MKLAILSDIHSNLEALQAVLAVVDSRSVDALYCLGDLVGYGADAAACVDIIRERCDGVVLGNHDDAVASERGVEILPRDGQKAVAHNRTQLSAEQLAYLRGLPLVLEADGCTYAHASPFQPDYWHRIDSFMKAQDQFNHFNTDVCFLGHTHVPAVVANKIGVLRVRAGHRFLLNVGSVGQPRDRNPNAAVAFFDTEAFTYEVVRVPYPIEAAAEKIIKAGLPKRLAERLHRGE